VSNAFAIIIERDSSYLNIGTVVLRSLADNPIYLDKKLACLLAMVVSRRDMADFANAASCGWQRTVQRLFEKHGAPIVEAVVYAYTALYAATENGHLDTVQYLV
jgi:hypothetical protein